MIQLAPIDPDAAQWLARPDGSGIGVNYADAVLKCLRKLRLADGRRLSCMRKGLQITLKIDKTVGTGLMRRLDHGPDVEEILSQALAEAGRDAGVNLYISEGAIWLEG